MKVVAFPALLVLIVLNGCQSGSSTSNGEAPKGNHAAALVGTHWRASDTAPLAGNYSGTEEYRTTLKFDADGFVAETLMTIYHIASPLPVRDSVLSYRSEKFLAEWHTVGDSLFIGVASMWSSYAYCIRGDSLFTTNSRQGRMAAVRVP